MLMFGQGFRAIVDRASCPGNGVARMESEGMAYLLYCGDSELGNRLERVLDGLEVQRVTSRKALLAPSMGTRAAVVGIGACADGDFDWLRSTVGPLSPPCVVVAPLSVNCLRRLYPLRSDRLRVVWTEEADSRLVEVLEAFRRMSRGPMWRLGLKLVTDQSLRRPVGETIGGVCGLHDAANAPLIPENSVGRLADHVDLAPPTRGQYWGEDVPLGCSLKEFLSWAVILWALRARSHDGWNAIADRLGLQRRTLQRNFNRLAGCTLAEAAEDPARVIRRFGAWVDSVWESGSGNGSRKLDPAHARAPGARVR